MIALDSSALLAYMFREAGHEIVAEKIGESCISTVNLSEVISRFARDGHDPLSNKKGRPSLWPPFFVFRVPEARIELARPQGPLDFETCFPKR